jgi:hypothetical protein
MSTGLGEIVLYRAADGGPALDVRLERESVWLDAHQMAELFGRDRTVIVRHIRNVYDSGELPRESTCAKNAQVAADGKVRQMDFYNLDMIISVAPASPPSTLRLPHPPPHKAWALGWLLQAGPGQLFPKWK